MAQRVEGSTHEKGHLLDPVFFSDQPLRVYDSEPVIWSDHFLLSFMFDSINPTLKTSQVSQKDQAWPKLPLETWKQVFRNSKPSLGSDLTHTNERLGQWLEVSVDAVVPIKSHMWKVINQLVPWFSLHLRESSKIIKKQKQFGEEIMGAPLNRNIRSKRRGLIQFRGFRGWNQY